MESIEEALGEEMWECIGEAGSSEGIEVVKAGAVGRRLSGGKEPILMLITSSMVLLILSSTSPLEEVTKSRWREDMDGGASSEGSMTFERCCFVGGEALSVKR